MQFRQSIKCSYTQSGPSNLRQFALLEIAAHTRLHVGFMHM